MSDWRDFNWREHVGRAVLDPHGPDGELLDTPTDRRWLWSLARTLDSASTEELRTLGRALGQYLHETCQHHDRLYPGDEHIPAHVQCLWCCRVVWMDITLGDNDE